MLKKPIKIAMVGLLLGAVAACEPTKISSAKKGAEDQETIMQKAIAQHPTPQTNNFLTRKTVVKWMERQDVPDRPHYVYVYSGMGQLIGYYVAQSRPVSTCTFLTPPERVMYARRETGVGVGTAPALDGVYYGAGGGCDQWFFFDAETDALIEMKGFDVVTSDQPLAIDAEPIRVQPAAE